MRRSVVPLAVGGFVAALALVLLRSRSESGPEEPCPAGCTETVASASAPAPTSAGGLRAAPRVLGAEEIFAPGAGATASAAAGPRPGVRRAVESRRIVDEEGRPVVGAQVSFERREAGDPLPPRTTDDRGAFEPPSDATHALVAVPGREVLRFDLAPFLRGPLRLVPTIRVSGRVVDAATARGVGGALVRSATAESTDGLMAAHDHQTTQSAADGSFRIAVRANAAHALAATAGVAHAREELRASSSDVSDVVLSLRDPGPGRTATGRVRAGGHPLPGVRVVLPSAAGRPEEVRSAPTDAEGRYEVGPVWSETFSALVDAEKLGLGVVRTIAAAAARPALGVEAGDLVVAAPWTIEGRVERVGVPEGGAKVVVTPPNSEWDGRSAVLVRPDGTFRVRGLFPRGTTTRLLVTTASGETRREEVRTPADGGDVVGLRVELGAAGRIRGRVMTRDGAVLAGAEVIGRTTATTGDDGRFEVLADAGITRVALRAPGFVSRSSAWVDLAADGVADLDVVLDEGDVVGGTVRDPDGRGVRDALVRVVGQEGIGGSSTVRVWAADGTFRTAVVAGASLRLTVTADGFEPFVRDGVEPGAEVAVVLRKAAPPK